MSCKKKTDVKDNSDDEVGLCVTPRKKCRLQYEHKFQEKWLTDERFKSWLEKCKDNNDKAFCKVCRHEVAGSVTLLERHSKTAKHLKNFTVYNQSNKLTKYMQPSASNSFMTNVASAELKLCAFIAENNLAISLMDKLPGLIANACPDSQIAKELKCGRTKSTGIFHNVVSQEYFNNVVIDLRITKFSLIIDESTDLSCIKHLVIICRFYDKHCQKTCDKFLTLLEVKDGTAEGPYNLILNFFLENEIPFENLIGFACDNASVMMGHRSGVQALLKKKNPNLFVQGCICHSIHLCASIACKELPAYLEELARNIYSYISNSPKRISVYQEFQKFTNIQPHKLLHLSSTRWLSLEAVIKRILEQWNALVLYFTSEALESGMASASLILKALENPVTKMYYAFLAYILPAINKINVEFQAESLRIHKLSNSLYSGFKAVLNNFIKRDVVKKTDISKIEFSNPANFLGLDEVYCGAKSESIHLESSNITKKEFEDFKIKALNFYIALTKQMAKRFASSEMMDNFQLLEALDPFYVKQGIPQSIIPLAIKFPNLVYDSELEELNKEWREVSLNEIQSLKELSEPEMFWLTASQEKCGDQFRFPYISKFMMSLMSLPHSSAAAERIFSSVTNIKSKNRSKLSTATLNGLLQSKSLLLGTNSKSWQPSKELIKSVMDKKNWRPKIPHEEEYPQF